MEFIWNILSGKHLDMLMHWSLTHNVNEHDENKKKTLGPWNVKHKVCDSLDLFICDKAMIRLHLNYHWVILNTVTMFNMLAWYIYSPSWPNT